MTEEKFKIMISDDGRYYLKDLLTGRKIGTQAGWKTIIAAVRYCLNHAIPVDAEMIALSEELQKKRRDDYFTRNRDKINQRNRDWQAANKEHIQEYHRQYYKENAETIKETADKWHKAHPERAREFARKSYAKNPQRKKKTPYLALPEERKEEIRRKARERYQAKKAATEK